MTSSIEVSSCSVENGENQRILPGGRVPMAVSINDPLHSLQLQAEASNNFQIMESERGRSRSRMFEPVRRTATSGTRGSSGSRLRSKSPAATRQAHGVGDAKLTNGQACMHMVKASLGTGVLALPCAVKNAGLLLGSLGIFVTAWIIVHSMQLLVEVAQYIRSYFDLTEEEDLDLDYAETMSRTFNLLPSAGYRLQWLVPVLNACLIISQIGFLSVYIVFVSENISLFVTHFAPQFMPPMIVYNILVVIVILPLCFIKTLEKMTVLSMIANVSGFLGLGIILICCFTDLKPVDSLPLVKNFDTIPLFFGTIVFSFESINLVLPIENKMQEQKAFPGSFGVLTLASSVVVAFDVAIGFYGYLRFGENVAGSITYSMPDDMWYYLIVKLLYSLSIFITYALQFYVVFVIIWEKIENRLYTPRMMFWGNIILRLSILLVSFLLATVVPHVELMISLSGASSGAAISLIFPPFLHSIIVWTDRHQRSCYPLTLAKNAVIMLFGFCGAVVGTYTTILAIIEVFTQVKN